LILYQLELEAKAAKRGAWGKSKLEKYSEIIADRLPAEGRSNGIAEHLPSTGFFFASMHTATENDSSLT